ncbi:MAG: hypothetical protein WEA79_11805 [Balneolaceae bacterium]
MNELITNIVFFALGILYGGICIMAIWYKVYLPLVDWIEQKRDESRGRN